MIFRLGLPPDVRCTLRDAQRVTFNLVRLQVIATALGVLVLLPILYFLWGHFFANDVIFRLATDVTSVTQPLQFIGLMIATTALHELCHLIAHPRFGLSDQSYVGIDKKSGMPYVMYNGVMSFTRFIVTGLAPIAVLSIGSLGLALLYPGTASYLALISLFNIVGAGGDVIIIGVTWWRAPRNAYIQREYFGLLP